jgi:predicted nucleic acid-binding protein
MGTAPPTYWRRCRARFPECRPGKTSTFASSIEVVAMTGAETWPFLRALPGSGIAGGSSYDAQIAACARKAKAGVILTWNVRDFERVAEGVEVASPEAR